MSDHANLDSIASNEFQGICNILTVVERSLPNEPVPIRTSWIATPRGRLAMTMGLGDASCKIGNVSNEQKFFGSFFQKRTASLNYFLFRPMHAELFQFAMQRAAFHADEAGSAADVVAEAH
jgi:hypothetical protein